MPKGRIVNGKVAKKGTYPWQAALYTGHNFFMCGASLITDRHILTAGHCAHNMNLKGWYVMLGMNNQIFRDGSKYELQSVTIHPDYTKSKGTLNDIAIGKTLRHIQFTRKIQPVCINEEDVSFGGKVGIVTGWGQLKYQGVRPSTLQEGKVAILAEQQCRDSLIGFAYRNDIMLCSSAYPVDACLGDSGGPLVVQMPSGYALQVGIISFGINCSGPESAGIYTKISKYYDWLMDTTKDGVTCARPL